MEQRGLFSGSIVESDLIEPTRRERGGEDSPSNAVAYERSVYQPSARSRPFALLASAGAILGIAAGMATLNMVAEHRHHRHLTVVDIHELDVTPPPPPPQQTSLDTPEPPSQTFAPKPLIQLPVPGPQQLMADAPPVTPPPAPAQTVTASVSPAPPAAPAPATTTLDGGDLSSKMIAAKPPSYPVDSRRAHEQGTVKLLLLVGSDGTVSDIQIASSSGSARLDRAALQAVRHWRWSPTVRNGAAVVVRGYVTIPFVLSGSHGTA